MDPGDLTNLGSTSQEVIPSTALAAFPSTVYGGTIDVLVSVSAIWESGVVTRSGYGDFVLLSCTSNLFGIVVSSKHILNLPMRVLFGKLKGDCSTETSLRVLDRGSGGCSGFNRP